MHVAMSIGPGIKSCTLSGFSPCRFRYNASRIIAGRSQPAEIVGGDVYDFLQINPQIMGVAIGDATGHGLPAALQARDVITGLRMGISEDHKMVKLFERLNKVIATQLGTSEQTIKVHRGRVMHKMQVQSVADLVRLCEKVGIRVP